MCIAGRFRGHSISRYQAFHASEENCGTRFRTKKMGVFGIIINLPKIFKIQDIA